MNETRPPALHAINRRAFPRKSIRQSATVTYATHVVQVRTWDLSGDGICLLSPKPVSPGRVCRLTFVLPLAGTDKSITAAVKVIYSSYTGPGAFKIGAVFADLDAQAGDDIEAFLAAP
ncbi:MAG: PilZ domain-containing protein [Steroidobacteraceae bacterium]